MIEKKRPRKLNSTRDSRVRGADEMYDAVNINVSTDHDASEEGGAGGDGGVIKPADGNDKLLEFEGIPTERTVRIVSSFLDDQHDIIYYFVWCDYAQYQGIYAYDTKGFFPEVNGNSNKVKLVYRTKLFKFDSDRYIKADLVVLSKEQTVLEKDYDVDPVIYFTDGKNEPRKIHVLDAYRRVRSTTGKEYDVDDSPLGNVTLTGDLTARYEAYDTQDYIHACPKTPVQPPKAFFTNDPLSRVSNFENISGLQFSYQYIYDTGEESAISSYSDVVIPNGYLQQGARPSANLSLDNICVIRLPLYKKWQEEGAATPVSSANAKTSDFAVRYIPKNVKKIRILGREGNLGSFFVIDTIENPMFSGSYPHEYLEYQFRNDRIKTGFSKTEAQKPFDSTPLIAGTQAAASNRMMYGDYVTGYDNVDVQATATINYKERGEDFKTIDINVSSTIDFLEQSQEQNYVNDRKAAIVFDVSDFPSDDQGLPLDSQVDVIITLRPKRNWHIYNARNSFHGSRHIGNVSGAVIEGTEFTGDNDIQPWEVGPNLAADGLPQVGTIDGAPGIANNSRSRTVNRSNAGLNEMWGDNPGVCIGQLAGGQVLPKWKTVDSQYANQVGTEVNAVFGTSAANPFILRGRPLLFQLSFKVIREVRGSDYKAKLKDYIQRVLGGIPLQGIFYPGGESPFFETLYVNREFEYSIDEGLDGGSAETTQDEAASGDNNKIDVLSDSDDRKHLIISVGNRDKILEFSGNPQAIRNLAPCGYIVVNKARPRFSLKARGALSDGSNFGVLQINLDRIGRFSNPDDVEILTAIPFVNSDQWLDKGMVVNPGNFDEQNGADETRQWYNSFGLFEAGSSLTTNKNWGLWDVSAWQFETKVIDSWWCFSKEFMARNTVPSFLFTSEPNDYARYANGALTTAEVLSQFQPDPNTGALGQAWNEFVDDATSWLGLDSLDGIESDEQVGQVLSDAAYGVPLPQVTNNGRLKNAAAVRLSKVEEIIKNSADPGVFSQEQLAGIEGFLVGAMGGLLHFRHNATGYIGGDGMHPCTLSEAFKDFNGRNLDQAGRAKMIGWLDSGEGWLSDVPQKIYAGSPFPLEGTDPWEAGFTTLDGAGGIGSTPGGGEARLRYDVDASCAMGSVNAMMVFHGYIGPRSTFLPTATKNGSKPSFIEGEFSGPIYDMYQNRYSSYINNYGQDCMMPFLGQFNYLELNRIGSGDIYGYRWKSPAEVAANSLGGPPQGWPKNNVKSLYYATPLDISDIDGSAGGQIFLPEEEGQWQNHDWRVDYELTKNRKELLPEILDVGGGTLLGDELKSGWRSFKTRANHDFGIVFYDERGRAGRVNPIVFDTTDGASPTNEDGVPIFPTLSSSLYVQGYGERDGAYGNVSINLNLNQEATPPPPWATHYQIVYGGNSTKSNFVQYVTGGAFVAIGDEESAEEENTNIYVSLNYLQGNKDVSYAESFGAVSPQGAKQLYTYTPGDKLRVISYYTGFNEDAPKEGREFPVDYEFEIVGHEVLSSNPEDNPIHRSFADNSDSSKMSDAKSGQFLILKNNPFAAGFTFNDVKNGKNEESTSQHFWNNICVVEIYSPTRESADQEQKLYYEISRVYDIGKSKDDGSKYYKTNPILLERGDVWWRQVPLAVPKYVNGKFENLIKYNVEEEESSQPRFQPYWLESKTFNDTFSGNDVIGRGKPNIIDDEFGQKRNKSGIVYSDAHIFDKSKNRFSSFNSLTGNHKIFPGEHGKIEHLLNNYDSLLMFQEDKVSAVPVGRTILSTADGSNSLIQSKEVLGIQSFYAGDYGTGGNPESVLDREGYIFFASKQNSEVYRLTIGGSIEVISSLGLKNDFYNVFRQVSSNPNRTVWIPTGYDPINDEFLVTIESISRLATYNTIVSNGQFAGEVEADLGEDVTGNDPDVIGGCSDPNSNNYSIFATGESNEGTCVYLGCTTPEAINYDPAANQQCDNSVTTQVSYGQGDPPSPAVNHPNDCVCRYFEPCIFDVLSTNPNGGTDYDDIVDFNELAGTNVTIPNGSTQDSAFAGNLIFEDDILNLIGLDLVWALRVEDQSTIPPAELNPNNDEWLLGVDEWNQDTYHFAIAKYTQGPPGPVGDINPAFENPLSQTWQNSNKVEWWDGFTPGFAQNYQGVQVNFDSISISDGYWVRVQELSAYNTAYVNAAIDGTLQSNPDTQEVTWIPNLDTNPNELAPPSPFWEDGYAGPKVPWTEYNPSGNGCSYTACKNPDAINYDPSADDACPGFNPSQTDPDQNEGESARLIIQVCGYFPDNATPSTNALDNILQPYTDIQWQLGTNSETGEPRYEIVSASAANGCCQFVVDFSEGPLEGVLGSFEFDAVAFDTCVGQSGNPEEIFIHSCTSDAYAMCPYYSGVNIGIEIGQANQVVAYWNDQDGTNWDSIKVFLGNNWIDSDKTIAQLMAQSFLSPKGYITTEVDASGNPTSREFFNVKDHVDENGNQIVSGLSLLNNIKAFFNNRVNPTLPDDADPPTYILSNVENNVYCESSNYGNCDPQYTGNYNQYQYVYWDGCCQFECRGVYPAANDDSLLFVGPNGESLAELYIGTQFITPSVADELNDAGFTNDDGSEITPGPRACWQRLYRRDEWEGLPAPEDYDPT